MRKKSIGEVLKLARTARGWTLEQLQRMIKIQARHLQALEENDFEAIGDREYARAFIERYAEALELDAEVILDAFDRNSLIVYYEAGEEPEFASDFRRSKKTPQKKNSYLPLIYLLLTAVAIFVFIAYIVSARIQNQVRPTQKASYSVVSKSSSTEASSSSIPEESTASSSSEEEKPSSDVELTVTGADPNIAVTVSKATKPVEVVLSVTDTTSWIALTDTELANGATLSPENRSVTVTIPEGVNYTTLTLGVVQGVKVEVAGKTVAMSGLTSQTGYITFTIE
ncbi:helix-turn-helix domain-containing protein [Streptococcus cameli]